MAGLDQTQKNALAGLQEAYKSANASQKAAIDMVVQGGLPQMAQNAHMEKNGERMLEGLQKGVDDGLIDKDTAKKIAGDYFSRSLGGNPLADGVLPSGKPDTKGYKEAAKGIEDIARKEKWSPERKEKELDALKKQYNIGTGGEQQTTVSTNAWTAEKQQALDGFMKAAPFMEKLDAAAQKEIVNAIFAAQPDFMGNIGSALANFATKIAK